MFFPSPFAPKNLVSRDGSAVPSRVSPLILQTYYSLKLAGIIYTTYVWPSHIILLAVWINRVARRQLNGDRSCLRIWSSETSSAIPSRVSLLILHTQTNCIWCLSTGSFPSFRLPRRHLSTIIIYCQPSSSSSYCRGSVLGSSGRAIARTDGVHRRESTGTGPVVIEVA